jgi:hypothetical protein
MSPEPARPEPHEPEPESPIAEPQAQSRDHKENQQPPTWFLWEHIFHRATNAAGKSGWITGSNAAGKSGRITGPVILPEVQLSGPG